MTETYEKALIWGDGRTSPHLGTRFDHAGRFLPEQGNTVVAQVIPGSATEIALIELRSALQSLPHADHFAFTTVESYHMTVFEGVIDSRRVEAHWPEGVGLNASIDDVTAEMIARLKDWQAPQSFAMRVTAVTPFGLRLTGATPADEAMSRDWRDALSAAFRLRTPGHATYGFHTTLAYVRAGLPPEAMPDLHAAMADLTARIKVAIPVMHLSRPAFCRFSDMNAFPPIHAL